MTTSNAVRAKYALVDPKGTALLICDIQEKNRETIDHFAEITTVADRLIDAAELLGLKIVATEHESEHQLAHSTARIKLYERNIPIFQKTSFSMCIPEVCELLDETINTVILCGIETHVCVYQTAIDFLAKGFNVHVVVDAVSSRSPTDRKYAFKQLKSFGANLTTAECIMFDIVKSSDSSHFEGIKNIFLEIPPDTGLVNQCK